MNRFMTERICAHCVMFTLWRSYDKSYC